jgi:hypothetical protein
MFVGPARARPGDAPVGRHPDHGRRDRALPPCCSVGSPARNERAGTERTVATMKKFQWIKQSANEAHIDGPATAWGRGPRSSRARSRSSDWREHFAPGRVMVGAACVGGAVLATTLRHGPPGAWTASPALSRRPTDRLWPPRPRRGGRAVGQRHRALVVASARVKDTSLSWPRLHEQYTMPSSAG